MSFGQLLQLSGHMLNPRLAASLKLVQAPEEFRDLLMAIASGRLRPAQAFDWFEEHRLLLCVFEMPPAFFRDEIRLRPRAPIAFLRVTSPDCRISDKVRSTFTTPPRIWPMSSLVAPPLSAVRNPASCGLLRNSRILSFDNSSLCARRNDIWHYCAGLLTNVN